MSNSKELNFDQKCRKITKNLGMHYYDWLFFDEESMCEMVDISYSDYKQWCDDMGQDKVRQIRNSGVPEKYKWTHPIPKLHNRFLKDHPGMYSIPELSMVKASAEYWNNHEVLTWLDEARKMYANQNITI